MSQEKEQAINDNGIYEVLKRACTGRFTFNTRTVPTTMVTYPAMAVELDVATNEIKPSELTGDDASKKVYVIVPTVCEPIGCEIPKGTRVKLVRPKRGDCLTILVPKGTVVNVGDMLDGAGAGDNAGMYIKGEDGPLKALSSSLGEGDKPCQVIAEFC